MLAVVRPVLKPEALERQRPGREPVDTPARCSNPHAAFVVLEQRIHTVGANAVRVVRVVAITNERLAIFVEFEQAPAAGTQPERPVAILVNGPHSGEERVFRTGAAE